MQVRALSEQRAGRRTPTKHESILDLVGGTPLVRLNRLTRALSPDVEVWVKLEFLNPGGSIKDRTARQIIEDAVARGDLDHGRRLLDATSGHTGIAYAMLGAALDIPVTLVMPEDTNPSRRQMIECFGGEVVHSSAADGNDGAIRLARELAAENPDTLWYADQYSNPSNPRAHEMTTAPEIWKQTGGAVTHFVTSTGTSGTLMGTGRGLKAHNPAIEVFGCQPAESNHGLEGLKHIATTIRPDIYDETMLAGTLYCATEEGWAMSERLAAEEGLAAGLSAGANVWAALEVASDLERGVVVTIACDHADRYLDE